MCLLMFKSKSKYLPSECPACSTDRRLLPLSNSAVDSHFVHQISLYLVFLLYILGLFKDEIIANAILFYLAGFETTASTLNWLFYELAMNPEQQQKVRLGKASALTLGVFQSEIDPNPSQVTLS